MMTGNQQLCLLLVYVSIHNAHDYYLLLVSITASNEYWVEIVYFKITTKEDSLV